jgi:hypothetical protein
MVSSFWFFPLNAKAIELNFVFSKLILALLAPADENWIIF